MNDYEKTLLMAALCSDNLNHKKVIKWAADEITTLRQQLTTAQAENEALRARVAELEYENAGLAAAADSLSMDVYDIERQSEGGE